MVLAMAQDQPAVTLHTGVTMVGGSTVGLNVVLLGVVLLKMCGGLLHIPTITLIVEALLLLVFMKQRVILRLGVKVVVEGVVLRSSAMTVRGYGRQLPVNDGVMIKECGGGGGMVVVQLFLGLLVDNSAVSVMDQILPDFIVMRGRIRTAAGKK